MSMTLVSFKWRDKVYPYEGRFVGPDVWEHVNVSVQASHYHVKISPKNSDEIELLEEDNSLTLMPVPFNREIIGQGTVPFAPATEDPETLEETPTGPLAPLYAIIPVTKSLPAGISYQILDSFFIPDEAGFSEESAEVMIDQAMFISGEKTLEETRSSSGWWHPSGRIRVLDTELSERFGKDTCVGVPSIRVYAYSGPRGDWSYTDKDGNFHIEKKFKGPVKYYIEWSTRDFKMKDKGNSQAYTYGPTQEGAWNLDIPLGYTYGLATMARATSSHFYGKNMWGRVSDHKTGNRLRILYVHKHNPNESGHFHHDPVNRHIVIYGLYENGENLISPILLKTTFHELGHAAMFFKCKKVSGIPHYSSMKDQVLESWASFIGWMMANQEYKALGHWLAKTVIWDYDHQGSRPRIAVNYGYFEVPDDYNKQQIDLIKYQTSNAHEYTPMYIDLIDNSNQKEYYRLFVPSNTKIFPNDNLCVKNYERFIDVVYQSRNFTELKAHLLADKEALSITEQAINDYFAFYGL